MFKLIVVGSHPVTFITVHAASEVDAAAKNLVAFTGRSVMVFQIAKYLGEKKEIPHLIHMVRPRQSKLDLMITDSTSLEECVANHFGYIKGYK